MSKISLIKTEEHYICQLGDFEPLEIIRSTDPIDAGRIKISINIERWRTIEGTQKILMKILAAINNLDIRK